MTDPSADLRHELRTPLNHIIGYSELLLEETDERGHAALEPGLRSVHGDARRLLKLINELLSVPHADAGGTALELGLMSAALMAPATRIVATCANLRAQAIDAGTEGLLPDLERIALAANQFRTLISGGVGAPAAGSAAEDEAWAGTEDPVASGERGVILVVDDDGANRDMLSRRLARQHYRVQTASGGRHALELLHMHRVDLILLDVMMPELNGYEVLEHLKADSKLRDIPVIMISALEEIESVIRCIELGAEDYLPKPFDPTLLRARVGATLEKKRLRDEVRANFERMERELDGARTLQVDMLPQEFPEWSNAQPVEVHAVMEPAREVGGDFYDFFYASEGRFCFLLGDVSGKGAPAAMFMARTLSLVRMAVDLLRRFGGEDVMPGGIAEAANRQLCQGNHECMFVTLFIGVLDTRTGLLTYANAGHPAPHMLRAGGDIDRIRATPETALGVRRDAVYSEHSIRLEPGDTVFVCSDGVTEANNAGLEFYTDERLGAELRAASACSPVELTRAVKASVDTFSGEGPKTDDVTMLALRWRPQA